VLRLNERAQQFDYFGAKVKVRIRCGHSGSKVLHGGIDAISK
jgi:hypothetical protein